MKMFLILVLVISVSCERSPRIDKITENQIKRIGSSVELSCSVLYLQAEDTVVWNKYNPITNDKTIISSDTTLVFRDSRYSFRYDQTSTTYTIQIKDIQESDVGIYRCDIWLSSTNHISNQVSLTVYSPPVIFENSTSKLVFKEGDSVKLECYAEGNPKPMISWKRENNAILPTGGSIYRGSTLKINSIRKEDRGTYYCTADNLVGAKVKKSYVVQVEFIPFIIPGKREVYQALQFDAELICRIEAFPAPMIVWLREGSIVPNNKHYDISEEKAFGEYTESILRIKKIEREHLGTYICQAVNKLKDDKAIFYLYESSSPVCPPACGPGQYSNSNLILPQLQIVLFTVLIIRMWR